MDKTMKLLAVSFLTLAAPLATLGQAEDAGWIRNTALSPDGKVVAFTYQGDIFTVPVSGGIATQITSNPAYDTAPVWSPDGQSIAFSSDREFGTFHVYLTSRQGGQARKLTYINGKTQTPVAFLDNETILYECGYRTTKESGIFPGGSFSQVYRIKTTGGRPHLFSAFTMKMPSINRTDGRILFTDFKGYEDPLRKHHKSPVARDIWMWTPDGNMGKYAKITAFEGEDRNAIWLPGEEAFLFLSERDGNFNVYRATLADPTRPTQLTNFKKHPVRNLSMDNSGNIAFSWNGRLYYMPKGGEVKQLPVQVIADNSKQEKLYVAYRSGASEAKLSPNDKEYAFIVHGDVYVANIEYGTTKRITNTPEQERDLTFSPDGRTLVYSSEREDQWNLYQTTIKRPDEKTFTYATELEEKKLTHEKEVPAFQPVFSPDGKKIAYLRDRAAVYCLDLASGKSTEVLNKKYNYSYSDGDQWFTWSPDSRYILTNFMGNGGWNNADVALVKADGTGELVNLTETGYNAVGARFVLDGKAIAYYCDYAGYRSHGSWGSQTDIYLMFLDQDAYDRFLLDKEEREVLLKDKDEKKESADKSDKDKKKKGKKDKKSKDENKVKPLVFDFSNRDKRIVRITRTSGSQSDFAVTPEGDKFYYLASFDGTTNLYCLDLAEKETKEIVGDTGSGSLEMSKDGKTLYLFGYNGFKKIEGRDITPLTYSARFEYSPAKERAYIYDHMVRQVENKFYDANLHGVDWKGYSDSYREILPYINNNYDFAELCSELLGELNGSHTGMRYFGGASTIRTASLGLFYDDSYEGEGAKIAEVIVGGPFDRAKSIAKPGVIVLKINGTTISKDLPIEHYLNGLTGQRTVVTLRDESGKEVEESVVPISLGKESSLLYNRWVDRRADLTEKWSNGRVGYVHIEGMDSESFRRVFSKMLGKYRGCDAIVVDTRHNGGGWLHNDVAILLSGKEYARFQPRGQYIGSEPFMQWYKPSNMLVSEDNYSDAYGTPWTYQTLKLGKLVGTPVAGTMTAVWWETQVNEDLVFGIPQVTMTGTDNLPRENRAIYPEITVYNSPEDFLTDNDLQLKAAIDDLIQRVDSAKK